MINPSLLRNTLGPGKLAATLVFCLSLIAALFQVGSFVALGLLARLIERSPDITPYGISFDFLEGRMLWLALLIPILFALSMLTSLILRLLVTGFGRRYMQTVTKKIVHKIRDALGDGRIIQNVQSLSGTVKYDCRYLAVTYMQVLMIVYPLILTIAILGVGFWFSPVMTGIIFGAFVISIPLHLRIMRRGADASIRLRRAAKGRHTDIDRLMQAFERHPRKPVLDDERVSKFLDSQSNQDFYKAYVERQRITSFSQSLTNLSMAIALLAILVLLFVPGQQFISFVGLIIAVIVFRVLAANLRSVLQSFTSISALQPYCESALRMLNAKQLGEKAEFKVAESLTETTFPLVLFLPSFSAATARLVYPQLAEKLGVKAEAATILCSRFPILRGQWRKELGIDVNFTTTSFLKTFPDEEGLADELRQFIRASNKDRRLDGWDEMSRTTRFLLTGLGARNAKAFIVDGSDMQALSPALHKWVLDLIGEKPVLYLYDSAPSRLRTPNVTELAYLQDLKIEHLGPISDYPQLREDISTRLVEGRKKVADDLLINEEELVGE